MKNPRPHPSPSSQPALREGRRTTPLSPAIKIGGLSAAGTGVRGCKRIALPSN